MIFWELKGRALLFAVPTELASKYATCLANLLLKVCTKKDYIWSSYAIELRQVNQNWLYI
jgi:hypothetical protein